MSQRVRTRPVRADERRMRDAEHRPARVEHEPDDDGARADRGAADGTPPLTGRGSPAQPAVGPAILALVRRLAPLLALALAGCGSARCRRPAGARRPAGLAGAQRAPRRSGAAGPGPAGARRRRRLLPRPAGDRLLAAGGRSTRTCREPVAPPCSTAATTSRSCAGANASSRSTTRIRWSGSGAPAPESARPSLTTDGGELLYVTDVAWRCAARLPPASVRARSAASISAADRTRSPMTASAGGCGSRSRARTGWSTTLPATAR